jgi:diacylglycerol O-acyltransferase / wax synthase
MTSGPGRSHRMSAADAAWVGLDRPEHLMVVTVVLRLGERLELDALARLVTDRLLPAYPTFRQRPVPSRIPLVPPVWRDDPAFDLAEHLREVEIGAEPELMAYVSGLMGTPLDLRRSPWTLTLAQHDGGSAVVARLHHCLADGIALAGVLLSLVDGGDGGEGGDGGAATSSARSSRGSLGGLVGTAVRTVGDVLVGRKDAGSRLRGSPSVGRRAAWTGPLDLEVTKRAAKRLEVSVNDVLLAAVAGGLRRWLVDQDQAIADCRVMVPVDLRRGAAVPAELGNRFGIVFVTLPLEVTDAPGRAGAVHASTTQAKSSAVAPASYGLLRLVGVMPRWAQGLAATLLGRIATGIVTNVPGPRTRLTLAGAPLTSIVFWVPHIGPIGIGFSIFSYAGTVTVGVATNESLDIDPGELVAAVEAELAELNELEQFSAEEGRL